MKIDNLNQKIKKHEKGRTLIQIGFMVLTNAYYQGFLKGSIFQGPTKAVCVPGLNCYSCPGALGSCPIGSFQAVISDRNYGMTFYIVGFLTVIGALMGRFVCGFLCPFGLFQDLLHKIPVKLKIRIVPGDKYLKYLKYLILLIFVVILPMFLVNDFGQGDPWFCKYICPSGTFMAGWPLTVLNEGIRGAIGWLFVWKSFILIGVILLSVFVYRPFCRYICPLGAFYGLFNKYSFYKFQVDKGTCIECGKCQAVCPINIPVYQTPNSAECIRCGKCLKVCPTDALTRVPYLGRSYKEGGEIDEPQRDL
jgi:ferredoxin-type protein NapH